LTQLSDALQTQKRLRKDSDLQDGHLPRIKAGAKRTYRGPEVTSHSRAVVGRNVSVTKPNLDLLPSGVAKYINLNLTYQVSINPCNGLKCAASGHYIAPCCHASPGFKYFSRGHCDTRNLNQSHEPMNHTPRCSLGFPFQLLFTKIIELAKKGGWRCQSRPVQTASRCSGY
jgi:hypothetical protein